MRADKNTVLHHGFHRGLTKRRGLKFTEQLIENQSPTHVALPCVVMHAGNDVMLILENRDGRFPVEVCVTAGSMIGWVCADTKFEFIEFKSMQGMVDHQILMRQIANDGLLVAEVCDVADPDVDLAKYNLIEFPKKSVSNPLPSLQGSL